MLFRSVGGMDRNTQPPTKIDPQLSRQSGTFHRQTVRVRGSMRSSFGVSVSIALPIEGEAVIALGAKSVRQARWMLPVLDYGNVRDVSHLGKNREGLQIRAIRKWSPTALQPWSLLYLRRNPPKHVLLRQSFGGHPLRIPPQLYSCGFLRRRVKMRGNQRLILGAV